MIAIATAAPAAPAVVSIALPRPRVGWFLCDAVDAPLVLLVGQVREGHSRVTLVPRGTGAAVTRDYAVGRGEGGMSQIRYPLTLAGRPAGMIRFVQPGVLADPAAVWTPTFASVTVTPPGQPRPVALGCRWAARTLFLGVAARRSVLVTQEGTTLVYRSFDAARAGAVVAQPGFGRSSVATLTIRGGRRDRIGRVMRFRFGHAGYGYDVVVPDGGAAHVAVARGGRVLQDMAFAGHMLAER